MIGFIAFIIGLVMWKKATPQGQPITYRIIAPIFLIVVGLVTICNVNYAKLLDMNTNTNINITTAIHGVNGILQLKPQEHWGWKFVDNNRRI